MAYKTDCYIVKKFYELDEEKIKRAFSIILNSQLKEELKNKHIYK